MDVISRFGVFTCLSLALYRENEEGGVVLMLVMALVAIDIAGGGHG